jgi:hypothetical protein
VCAFLGNGTFEALPDLWKVASVDAVENAMKFAAGADVSVDIVKVIAQI